MVRVLLAKTDGNGKAKITKQKTLLCFAAIGGISLATLNIVLVEPQIPQNTGSIARTCACTGAKLHLVGPMGFTITDAKLKRAGLDYWDKLNVQSYDSLDDFFEKNEGEFYFFTTKATQNHSVPQYQNGCYLLFGREDKGLDVALLEKNKQNCVRLPMQNSLRSLNLSNTVSVGVYEVLRQWNFPEMR